MAHFPLGSCPKKPKKFHEFSGLGWAGALKAASETVIGEQQRRRKLYTINRLPLGGLHFVLTSPELPIAFTES